MSNVHRLAIGLVSLLLVVASAPAQTPGTQDPSKLFPDIELPEGLPPEAALPILLEELNKRLQTANQTIGALRSENEVLRSQVGDVPSAAKLDADITNKIDQLVQIYGLTGELGDPDPLRETLKGGLFFSGSFRSRLDARWNNSDFAFGGASGSSSQAGPLDDEGWGGIGRFRIGIGASLLPKDSPTSLRAFTEFQAFGRFASQGASYTGRGLGAPNSIEDFALAQIYQGYIELTDFLAPELQFTIGRQEIALGNEFLLGANEFDHGRTLDALLVNWGNGKKAGEGRVELNGFAAKLAPSSVQTQSFGINTVDVLDGDNLYGVFAAFDRDLESLGGGEGKKARLTLEAYVMYFTSTNRPSGFASGVDNFTVGNFGFGGRESDLIAGEFWTIGTRAQLARVAVGPGLLTSSVEVAGQFGDRFDPINGGLQGVEVINRDLSSWGSEITINYWLKPPTQDGFTVLHTSYYRAEGGNQPGADGNAGFTPLFQTRNRGVSLENDVSVLPSQPYYPLGARVGILGIIPVTNVHAFSLGVAHRWAETWEFGASYTAAWNDNPGGEAAGGPTFNQGLVYGDGFLGHEFDVGISRRFTSTTGAGARKPVSAIFSAQAGLFIPSDDATARSIYAASQRADLGGSAEDDIALGVWVQLDLWF